MKRMSVWFVALLLVLALCSCSIMKGFAPRATGEAEPTQEPETVESTPTAPPESPAPSKAPVQEEPANLSGNLQAGGHVAMDASGALYVARRDGIYKVDGQETRIISGDYAHNLNIAGDRLVYVSTRIEEYEFEDEELVSIALDGSDRVVLGGSEPIDYILDFDYENYKSTVDIFTGYADVAVLDGYIYYIASNGNEGQASMFYPFEPDQPTHVSWNYNKSIYRMPVEGGVPQELVADIGNGAAHLCVAEGRLWYSTCWDGLFYPYPTVGFYTCALDGSDVQRVYGNDLAASRGATREIVNGLFVVNGELYVSASDSEGDFPNGRIMKVNGAQYEYYAEAIFYVNATADEQNNIFLFRGGEVLFDEQRCEDYLEKGEVVRIPEGGAAEDGEPLMTKENLLRFGEEFSMFEIYALGGEVYLLTDRALYTVYDDQPIASFPELD